MSLSGNKGEWSEIYTLFKLLGDGEMYAGDENLNKIQDIVYPIIMILRQEQTGKYNYKVDDKDVVILDANEKELLRVKSSVFLAQAEYLLKTIHENGSTFSIAQTEQFMNHIYCHTLKAKSSDKTDIRIILHDCRTKLNKEIGFSIKSQLGSNSTLLNAGQTTNFNFKIKNLSLTDSEIQSINSLSSQKNKVIERVNAIKKKGGNLIFDKVDNEIFDNNLTMLDRDLPPIIAQMLLKQLETGISSLKKLTELTAQSNPMGYTAHQSHIFNIYQYKIKHLLTSTALGMVPAKNWDGKYDANGGYLIVRKDGEILCYHFYDRNRLEDYLFCNSYLDRSSTTRHHYASIIKEADKTLSFKINLQIRMK